MLTGFEVDIGASSIKSNVLGSYARTCPQSSVGAYLGVYVHPGW